MNRFTLCSLLVISTISLLGCSLNQELKEKRDGYIQRAQTYYKSKKYLNALQQIELALEIDPEYKPANISKGWTLFYLERNDEAEESFLKAKEMDDSDSWMHYGLASVYFRRGNKANRRIEKAKARLAKLQDSKQKEAMLATIDKHEAEAKVWFEKSLDHFRTALRYNDTLVEIHKMIASTKILLGLPFYEKTVFALKSGGPKMQPAIQRFVDEGLPHYEQALAALNLYIEIKDKEYQGTETLLEKKKKERLEVAILEEEHKKIDAVVEHAKKMLEENRTQYRIAQGLAAEQCYQLAILLKGCAGYAKQHRDLYHKYVTAAKERVSLMLETSPDIKNAFLNLAKIAELEEDYQSERKYLQEYLQRFPTANPRDRVLAQQRVKWLEGQVPGTKVMEK